MSLHTRTTNDYSPLRGPIVDAKGRDMRPKKERQQYEQAVNARREMLNAIGSQPARKLPKKSYERLRAIQSPANYDPEMSVDQRRKAQAQANSGARRALKTLLHGVTVADAVESDDDAA